MKDQLIRFILSLKRPTKQANLKLLAARGETADSFLIREALSSDIPALAQLHVKAWNETYPFVKRPPSVEIRTYQWKELFNQADQKWCCFVVENRDKKLIGFARGLPYNNELNFEGELNKIYLLQAYQRLGLGRRLLAEVVNWFLAHHINSMVLFSEPSNPSIRFYEALKGERLYAANGKFNGAYAWINLKKLATMCIENKD